MFRGGGLVVVTFGFRGPVPRVPGPGDNLGAALAAVRAFCRHVPPAPREPGGRVLTPGDASGAAFALSRTRSLPVLPVEVRPCIACGRRPPKADTRLDAAGRCVRCWPARRRRWPRLGGGDVELGLEPDRFEGRLDRERRQWADMDRAWEAAP